MSDFYTSNVEEGVISAIIKALGYEQGELAKYYVLRIAIARSLRLEKFHLDSSLWRAKRLTGTKGGEYHLAQITGKGKGIGEDLDNLLRALFYMRHKEELSHKKIDIFVNDSHYLDILEKYIRRGLDDISKFYKSSDCFYQWCLDNLISPFGISSNSTTSEHVSEVDNYSKLLSFFGVSGVEIKLVKKWDSYRSIVYRVQVLNSIYIDSFLAKCKRLNDEFGCNVFVDRCEGEGRTYDIQISKKSEYWNDPTKSDYDLGLQLIRQNNFKIGVFAGMEIDSKQPFVFDLVESVHLLVAGTTGSGKTSFLCTMLDSLLRNDKVQVTVIDHAKRGADYRSFMTSRSINANLIDSVHEADSYLVSIVDDMKTRFTRISEAQNFDILKLGFKYRVILIDEFDNLCTRNKSISLKVIDLARQARQAGIYLVLGSQRPDAKTLDGALRSNIPSRIALKVQNQAASRIILDESGAEELSGRGDMLVKICGRQTKHVIGVKL